MIKNNRNYLDKILSDTNKNIENMSDSDLSLLYNELIKNPNDYKLLEQTFEKTKIWNELRLSDLRKPYWFTNDTNFEDNKWNIKINKKIFQIDFSNIIIDNDIKLTNIPNLLNTFKHWICIQGHPIYNKGLFLKPETLSINIKRIVNFINSILINSSKLQLSKTYLKNINENYILDYLTEIASTGQYNGSLNYNNHITAYLKENIKNIKIEDVMVFEKSYPLVSDNYTEGELKLTLDDIRKSRYWLYNNKGYSNNVIGKHHRRVFLKAFENKIIIFNQTPMIFKQLNLFTIQKNNEFLSLPCRTNEDQDYSKQDLQAHIKLLKTICYIHSQEDCAQIDITNFNEINIRRINKIISLRENGRYVTLPAEVVFKAINDSIEFIHQYLEVVLEALLKYSLLKKMDKNFSFNDFYSSNSFPKILKSIGIQYYEIKKDKNYYINLRKNRGFIDFYYVLLGSILLAIGAITARRTSEIIELDPFDCLLPKNIDPFLNKSGEFEIIFDNRKSGIGGVNYHREKLARPIVNFVAQIIFKIQNFNKKCLYLGLISISNISFINLYSSYTNSWSKLTPNAYNSHLDLFCDYFETKVSQYSIGDFRRYYIRQHQLRRFFCMMFFWSKSFDGLDTLRYFLGHTDIEHLYHYITEPLTGAVLNGVKAHTLTEAYLGNSAPSIKNIESLRDVLLKHFNVSDLEILSSDTIAHFEKSTNISNKINYLIDENIIDLQPHFFTVLDEKNEKIQQFELILMVEDII